MTDLSTGARSALIATGTSRQGTRVPGTARALTELREAGLAGLNNGLTQRGSIVRDRLMDEALDRAFG